jgi:hypothetical protein
LLRKLGMNARRAIGGARAMMIATILALSSTSARARADGGRFSRA